MNDKCPKCGKNDIRYFKDNRISCASCGFSWAGGVAGLRRQLQQAQEELAQAKIAALLEAANELGHERTYSGIYVDDELRKMAAELAGDGGEKGTDDA